MMDVMDAIYRRRSVRDYAGDAVDESMIRKIIDAATWAPSAINQQPWLFTVVKDQATLDRISSQAKAHLLSMPAGAVAAHLRDMLRNPDFQIFYHAPALILISARTAGPWMIEDCALAAQNLMLAAFAAGLGSCWIGFAQGWLQTSEGKTALNLPVDCLPVAPIIVGRPRSAAPVVPRGDPSINWIG
jgi:nitroreductase